MNMGKKYMAVVIVELKDSQKVPNEIRKELFDSKTGNTIPKGYIADMGGEKVLRHYSYSELKGKAWYKEFVEISKLEKAKPSFGTMAHMVTKEAEVEKLNKAVMSFRYGSSVKSLLSQFEKKAKGSDEVGKESARIVKVVNDWGQKEHGEIENLKSAEPTKAFIKMETLVKTFNGLPLVKDYPVQMNAMKKDKYFAYLLGLRKQYERLVNSEKVNANSAKYLSKKMLDFSGKVKDEALKKDAEKMAEVLSKY